MLLPQEKFAPPFHSPFRVKEVCDNGVVVCQDKHSIGVGIRVVLSRMHTCPVDQYLVTDVATYQEEMQRQTAQV